MKKILLILTALTFTLTSFTQLKKTRTYDKAWYEKKARHKQTTGIVFACAAVAYTVAGFLQPDSTKNNFFGMKDKNHDQPYYFAFGGIAAIASYLYFTASKKYKRLAFNASASLKRQEVLLQKNNGLVYRSQPTLTLKLIF